MNDLPRDFAEVLAAAGLTDFFADCTNAHRREYLKWIAEAKRAETRKDRMAKAVKMLSARCVEESAYKAKHRTLVKRV